MVTNYDDEHTKSDFSETVDRIDLQILNLLQDECRLSYNKIASKVQVSVGTAYNRIKTLETKSVLKSCTVLVEPLKLGFLLTAVIFIQTTNGPAELEKQIAEINNVIAVYSVTGEFDVVVIAKFKDRSNLSIFIKRMASLPFVKRTITNVSLNTIKEDFRIKLS